jgi:hypothetical protein
MSAMINKSIFAVLLIVSMLSQLDSYEQQPLTPASSGFAPVNGSKVYYEVYLPTGQAVVQAIPSFYCTAPILPLTRTGVN